MKSHSSFPIYLDQNPTLHHWLQDSVWYSLCQHFSGILNCNPAMWMYILNLKHMSTLTLGSWQFFFTLPEIIFFSKSLYGHFSCHHLNFQWKYHLFLNVFHEILSKIKGVPFLRITLYFSALFIFCYSFTYLKLSLFILYPLI